MVFHPKYAIFPIQYQVPWNQQTWIDVQNRLFFSILLAYAKETKNKKNCGKDERRRWKTRISFPARQRRLGRFLIIAVASIARLDSRGEIKGEGGERGPRVRGKERWGSAAWESPTRGTAPEPSSFGARHFLSSRQTRGRKWRGGTVIEGMKFRPPLLKREKPLPPLLIPSVSSGVKLVGNELATSFCTIW